MCLWYHYHLKSVTDDDDATGAIEIYELVFKGIPF